MKFEFLEHTADIKFRAYGGDLKELFENSFYALRDIFYKGKVEKKIKKRVEVKGSDLKNLLYNFLEEFLFLLDSEGFLGSEVKIKAISERELEAELYGDDAENYDIEGEVKAVTYSDMVFKREGGGWICEVVVDV